jgi:antirestriction protein ArdC
VVRVQEVLEADHGIRIPYSTLTRWVREAALRVPKARAGRYDFAPGEEMQFDTSPHRVVVAAKPLTAPCAALVLAYSRRHFIQYYPRFTRFEAKAFLREALLFMDGTARRALVDNTNVVVAAGSGPQAEIAPEMATFARIFGFEFRSHAIGDANRSARVQRPFYYVERNFLPARCFRDWDDLNTQARAWCTQVANQKPKRALGMSPEAAYVLEKPYLLALPAYLPPVYQAFPRTVDVEGYAYLDTNRYSVPERLIGKQVEVYKYPRVPYHVQVANKLIEQLKEGTAPWQKPWEPGSLSLPHNPVSGTRYRGGNAMWLQMQQRGDARWVTYKQAQSVGAQVRRGEKGTLVQYYKFKDQVLLKDDKGKPLRDAEGNKRYRTVELDRPKVFTAEQIDGLPAQPAKTPDWDRHERAEATLKASGIEIRYDQADRAFYRPATDRIHLPPRESFASADRFYSTALHEAAHGSGHSSRLDRDLAHPFGSEGYAKEELRAEIA